MLKTQEVPKSLRDSIRCASSQAEVEMLTAKAAGFQYASRNTRTKIAWAAKVRIAELEGGAK